MRNISRYTAALSLMLSAVSALVFAGLLALIFFAGSQRWDAAQALPADTGFFMQVRAPALTDALLERLPAFGLTSADVSAAHIEVAAFATSLSSNAPVLVVKSTSEAALATWLDANPAFAFFERKGTVAILSSSKPAAAFSSNATLSDTPAYTHSQAVVSPRERQFCFVHPLAASKAVSAYTSSVYAHMLANALLQEVSSFSCRFVVSEHTEEMDVFITLNNNALRALRRTTKRLPATNLSLPVTGSFVAAFQPQFVWSESSTLSDGQAGRLLELFAEPLFGAATTEAVALLEKPFVLGQEDDAFFISLTALPEKVRKVAASITGLIAAQPASVQLPDDTFGRVRKVLKAPTVSTQVGTDVFTLGGSTFFGSHRPPLYTLSESQAYAPATREHSSSALLTLRLVSKEGVITGSISPSPRGYIVSLSLQ